MVLRITQNESLTTTKENLYIFIDTEDVKGTEEIVESILDRYENVFFLLMDYDKLQRTLLWWTEDR